MEKVLKWIPSLLVIVNSLDFFLLFCFWYVPILLVAGNINFKIWLKAWKCPNIHLCQWISIMLAAGISLLKLLSSCWSFLDSAFVSFSFQYLLLPTLAKEELKSLLASADMSSLSHGQITFQWTNSCAVIEFDYGILPTGSCVWALGHQFVTLGRLWGL